MAASDSQPQTTSTTAASHLDWLGVAKQNATRKNFLEWIAHELSEIPPHVWAFSMVAPVERLAELVATRDSPTTPLFILHLDADIKIALDVWKQRGTKDGPADEDNNQQATKKRKTLPGATSRLRSETTSEAASEASSRASSEATEQSSDGRVQQLTTQVYHDITDFYYLLKLI